MPKPRKHPFYSALVAMGCEFCQDCNAYMFPDHTEHVTAFTFDKHVSRYAVVGGYGNVRLVDLSADAA